MEKQEKDLTSDKNATHNKESDSHEDDPIKNGQKAIAIQKEVNDLPDAEESKDAEKWRNEG